GFAFELEAASDGGGESGSDLDGRAFAAECDPAGEGQRAAEELTDHGAEADVSAAGDQGDFGLRNAAAPGVREEAIGQPSGQQGSGEGDDEAAPRGTLVRIEAGAEAFGEQQEGYGDDADSGADEDGQGVKEPALMAEGSSDSGETEIQCP